MTETILLFAKILGVLFILCKTINKFARVSDSDEVIDLMGESLSMRTGNFSSNLKD